MKNLNELPMEVQTRIKNTLKAYDKVEVFYEYGDYHFGVCLKATYGDDHEYIGTYKADEVYTEDERIENYINEFKSYPINYNGKKDWAMIHKMDERIVDWEANTITEWVGKLNENGDFELTEQITRSL